MVGGAILMALEKLGLNSKDWSVGQMHNTVTEGHVELIRFRGKMKEENIGE